MAVERDRSIGLGSTLDDGHTTHTHIIIIIRVFCPRAGLSLGTRAPRLQFYPKVGLPPQTQEPRLQFYCWDE